MTPWLLALLAGALAAALQYATAGDIPLARRLVPAALRALAVTLIVALLLDAPAARATAARPWAALDASASMTRAGDVAAFSAARVKAEAAGAESVFVFGDSVRPAAAAAAAAATDSRSSVRDMVERASASGRRLVVVTDGELPDGDALSSLAAGSRVELVAHAARPDAAVSSLEAPRALVAGDSLVVTATIVAGSAPVPAGRVALLLGAQVVAEQPLAAMAAATERRVTLRTVARVGEGTSALRVALRVAGDAEPHNDTLGLGIDIAKAVGAVVVSTSPDEDVRFAASVLRGALALPVRGYLQVAPGAWRVEGSLAPVSLADVRAALRDAPLAVLHGDTSAFGATQAATRAPLVLMPTGPGDDDEWYAAAAPTSPLAPALGSMPWDSLPPLTVARVAPRGQFTVLELRRGASEDRRAAITGEDSPRRAITVAVAGLWRWKFRGGTSGDAYTALWGGIFDWLAQQRADRRAALPEDGTWRAGEPLRWRRGSASDSAVTVVLRSRGSSGARADTIRLHFAEGSTSVESAGVAAGEWDVDVAGGHSTLVVNASRELLPGRVTVTAGPVGSGSATGDAPRLRDHGWAFAFAILALCGEWLLRRKAGMR
ncbi:MAG: hypothetical protein JWO05_2326 [Gemmatimonadetes bacterium]|nr:hypothetical protein [Gemmatimonadota bacterium]